MNFLTEELNFPIDINFQEETKRKASRISYYLWHNLFQWGGVGSVTPGSRLDFSDSFVQETGKKRLVYGGWGSTFTTFIMEEEKPKVHLLEAEFEERADRWERESGVHSSPGATYLYKDYLAIISLGRMNKKAIVPLILKRLQDSGSDWFFALENITDANPAKDAEDFDAAFDSWCEWATKNGIIKNKYEVLRFGGVV